MNIFEIAELVDNRQEQPSVRWLEQYTELLKAAHLAELLAGVEMPEPAVVIRVSGDKHTVYPAQLDDAKLFTLDQCQQAVAAAVARTKLECKK